MNITVVQKALILFRPVYCRCSTKTVMDAERVIDFTLFLGRSLDTRCVNPMSEKSTSSEGKLNKNFTIE
jgi:hypothetical protein